MMNAQADTGPFWFVSYDICFCCFLFLCWDRKACRLYLLYLIYHVSPSLFCQALCLVLPLFLTTSMAASDSVHVVLHASYLGGGKCLFVSRSSSSMSVCVRRTVSRVLLKLLSLYSALMFWQSFWHTCKH